MYHRINLGLAKEGETSLSRRFSRETRASRGESTNNALESTATEFVSPTARSNLRRGFFLSTPLKSKDPALARNIDVISLAGLDRRSSLLSARGAALRSEKKRRK